MGPTRPERFLESRDDHLDPVVGQIFGKLEHQRPALSLLNAAYYFHGGILPRRWKCCAGPRSATISGLEAAARLADPPG